MVWWTVKCDICRTSIIVDVGGADSNKSSKLINSGGGGAAGGEYVHFRLLQRIIAKKPDDHATRDRVLQLTDVPPMFAVLNQKRLRWVGHALRCRPTDHSRLNVHHQLTRLDSRMMDSTRTVRLCRCRDSVRQPREYSHQQEGFPARTLRKDNASQWMVVVVVIVVVIITIRRTTTTTTTTATIL